MESVVGVAGRNLLGSIISLIFLFGFWREFSEVLEWIHILGFVWGLEVKIVWAIAFLPPILIMNCDFALVFRIFVILPIFYENKESLPLLR